MLWWKDENPWNQLVGARSPSPRFSQHATFVIQESGIPTALFHKHSMLCNQPRTSGLQPNSHSKSCWGVLRPRPPPNCSSTGSIPHAGHCPCTRLGSDNYVERWPPYLSAVNQHWGH